MEHTHYVSVAGLVCGEGDMVLLVKSPERGWEFPGGLVEPGEGPEEALLREIREETGASVKVTGFAGICKNIDIDAVNIDFICQYSGGDLRTSEESPEVRWVKREEALRLVTYALTRKRLVHMLSQSDKVTCFSFHRDPFVIVREGSYPVGGEGKGKEPACEI